MSLPFGPHHAYFQSAVGQSQGDRRVREQALGRAYDNAGASFVEPPPEPAQRAALRAPNLAQLAAGGLAALLVPRLAAVAIAAPFQAGLQRQADETEANRALAAERMAAWQIRARAARSAVDAETETEEPTLPPILGAPAVWPESTEVSPGATLALGRRRRPL